MTIVFSLCRFLIISKRISERVRLLFPPNKKPYKSTYLFWKLLSSKMFLNLWTLPLLNFWQKKTCDAIICWGQEVHFDYFIFFFFSVPTRSIEEKKNLIQFFDARSESWLLSSDFIFSILFEHQFNLIEFFLWSEFIFWKISEKNDENCGNVSGNFELKFF